MTGANEFEAFDSFARPIEAALLCATQARLDHQFRPQVDMIQTPTFDDSVESVPLRRRQLPPLYLNFAHHFRLRPSDYGDIHRERFQIQTFSYFYSISDHRNSEILAFHWHPESDLGARPEPHLHVKIKVDHPTDPSLNELFPKLHIPTERVEIQSVVRLLIEQFGIQPVRRDWDAVLQEIEEHHRQFPP